jgi:hypothetical protein
MGRSPLSGWLLLWKLKRAGLNISVFGYMTTIEDFSKITVHLSSRISELSARDDYVLIGHSLGGVLLRAAINSLPSGTRPPRHLFLLGSPTRPARLAKRLKDNLIYRALTRDCGQLLASEERMNRIGRISVPVTGIIGVRGVPFHLGLFGHEANDGIVSVSEVSADWIPDEVAVPVVHTLLPSSERIAEIILKRIEGFPPCPCPAPTTPAR